MHNDRDYKNIWLSHGLIQYVSLSYNSLFYSRCFTNIIFISQFSERSATIKTLACHKSKRDTGWLVPSLPVRSGEKLVNIIETKIIIVVEYSDETDWLVTSNRSSRLTYSSPLNFFFVGSVSIPQWGPVQYSREHQAELF